MTVLAIDTSADFGSIAVVRDRNLLGEILLHAPQGFSQVLFAQLGTLLRECRVELTAIDLFAAASGPGSFTGVRIGLSAVKAFAEVADKPAVAVSNLLALASLGTEPVRAALIDARRGEVYSALYRETEGQQLTPVLAERVGPFPEFVAQLPDEPIEWICADFAAFAPALPGGPHQNDMVTPAPRALAAAVAALALDMLEPGGGVLSPDEIDANYVRRSDAELLWKGL